MPTITPKDASHPLYGRILDVIEQRDDSVVGVVRGYDITARFRSWEIQYVEDAPFVELHTCAARDGL